MAAVGPRDTCGSDAPQLETAEQGTILGPSLEVTRAPHPAVFGIATPENTATASSRRSVRADRSSRLHRAPFGTGYAYAVSEREGDAVEYPELLRSRGRSSRRPIGSSLRSQVTKALGSAWRSSAPRQAGPAPAEGAERLGNGPVDRVEGVRGAAGERGLRPSPREDLEDRLLIAASSGRGRPSRSCSPAASCARSGGCRWRPEAIGRGAYDERIELDRSDELGRCAGVQPHGRAPGGADRRAGATVAERTRAAGGREQAQVGVPGQHVPRAADAAERDRRLLPGAAAEALRRGERQAGGVPGGHPHLGRPPARADQRRARPGQGGGGSGRARDVAASRCARRSSAEW